MIKRATWTLTCTGTQIILITVLKHQTTFPGQSGSTLLTIYSQYLGLYRVSNVYVSYVPMLDPLWKAVLCNTAVFLPPSVSPRLLQSVCWKHQVFKVPSTQFQLWRRLYRLSLREGLLQGGERSSDDGLYTWVAATAPLCLLTTESWHRLWSLRDSLQP